MEWILVFTAGFLAAGVDGALGMGFGPTSAAIMLGTGFSPASTSVAVNIAKSGSGAAAAVAHWRCSNVDRRVATTLAVAGAAGAVIGVMLLAHVDTAVLRPALAALLLLVGLRILHRFGPRAEPRRVDTPARPGSIDVTTAAVGIVGGCTNGLIGAWGPVVTPYLVQRGVPVRIAVGSVNTAEVAVAVVAVGSLFGTGMGQVDVGIVVPMLLGGVAAAPLAARIVRHIPPRAAGIAVAALLLFSQVRELATVADVGPGRWIGYGLVAAAVAISARPTRPVERGVVADQPVVHR